MSLRVRPQLAQTGFTLTELVTVIVIAGILGAVIYNRISITSFGTDGYARAVKSAMRYAHKLAVAQRRNVYVTVVSNDVSICYDPGCGTAVLQPASADPFSAISHPGVTPTIGTPFYFDSLGRPHVTSTTALAAVTLTATVSDGTTSDTVSIEPQTGYVH